MTSDKKSVPLPCSIEIVFRRLNVDGVLVELLSISISLFIMLRFSSVTSSLPSDSKFSDSSKSSEGSEDSEKLLILIFGLF